MCRRDRHRDAVDRLRGPEAGVTDAACLARDHRSACASSVPCVRRALAPAGDRPSRRARATLSTAAGPPAHWVDEGARRRSPPPGAGAARAPPAAGRPAPRDRWPVGPTPRSGTAGLAVGDDRASPPHAPTGQPAAAPAAAARRRRTVAARRCERSRGHDGPAPAATSWPRRSAGGAARPSGAAVPPRHARTWSAAVGARGAAAPRSTSAEPVLTPPTGAAVGPTATDAAPRSTELRPDPAPPAPAGRRTARAGRRCRRRPTTSTPPTVVPTTPSVDATAAAARGRLAGPTGRRRTTARRPCAGGRSCPSRRRREERPPSRASTG